MKSILIFFFMVSAALLQGCFSDSSDYLDVKRDQDPVIASSAAIVVTLPTENTNDLCIDYAWISYKIGDKSKFTIVKNIKKPATQEGYNEPEYIEYDNDGDGFANCADPECVDLVQCNLVKDTVEAEDTPDKCQDNKDNDRDGDPDCEDSECASFIFCEEIDTAVVGATENTLEQCSDSVLVSGNTYEYIDNDDDGFANCADPECKVYVRCSPGLKENTFTLCGDDIDNDGDGKLDCLDTDCGIMTRCSDNGGGSGATPAIPLPETEITKLPGTIEAEDFLDSVICAKYGWGFLESDPTNGILLHPAPTEKAYYSDYRKSDAPGVEIELIKENPAGLGIAFFNMSEKYSYPVKFDGNGKYKVYARGSSIELTASKVFTIIDPRAVDRICGIFSLTLTSAGSFLNWHNYHATDTVVTDLPCSGERILQVSSTKGEFNLDKIVFQKVN